MPDNLKTALFAVMGAAETAEIAGLLDALWEQDPLTVRQPPETALVMVTVRDPFDSDFHLGEALITSAQVACDGTVGHGAIMGDAPERALLLAAVEALERAGCTSALALVAEWVARMAPREAHRKQAVAQVAAATTVRFDSMRQERVDFGSLGG